MKGDPHNLLFRRLLGTTTMSIFLLQFCSGGDDTSRALNICHPFDYGARSLPATGDDARSKVTQIKGNHLIRYLCIHKGDGVTVAEQAKVAGTSLIQVFGRKHRN